MTTLTATATFTIGTAAVEIDTATVTVLPGFSAYNGPGRLIHPTLGVYDYERPPDAWTNMDGDAIIPPVWASTKTLLGAANTLFVGNIRDVEVEEQWTQGVACTTAHLRALVSFWSNPPDPDFGYVQWLPTYTSTSAYNVILAGLTAGGRDIMLQPLSRQGYVRGPIVLKLRIVSKVV